ncbi:DJ-1/PfpI family protein [Epidermidibacterium keratini]|uniref:DJ-1/PfpI family protein n=1 Tax=Epidermidibacterium keratini TaxID=1891644 RepID=A0A7L4YMV0_9ACTN|nr:DJ-1/PfpI family protein [Epidermidibacterium keratini]QHC00382.1 DJ-1/PfpI family protein [Epidermidibacterium keratini]
MSQSQSLRVAIVIFDRFTALDAVGPYEVLQRIPQLTPTFIARERGVVRTENGFLGIEADATYDELPDPDIIVMPGGVGTRKLLDDQPTLQWVRRAHETSRFTTSVCTGSLVLGAAGVLDGLTATTHWRARDILAGLGAVPVEDRVVEHLDRRIITAAGVSSGIDMALRLLAILTDEDTAKAVQLQIEYDPQPPFDSGSTAKADPETIERAAKHFTLRA